MLEQMADRAADYLAEITVDPGIKDLRVSRDWGAFTDFFMALIDKLMPLIDKCFVTQRHTPEPTAADIVARAATWEPVLDMSRRKRRREIGILENILLSQLEREVGRRIDAEVGDEFNNAEIFEACVHTIATSSPEDTSGTLHLLRRGDWCKGMENAWTRATSSPRDTSSPVIMIDRDPISHLRRRVRRS